MTYLEKLFSLNGKTSLVTGASRGIGKALAEGQLRAGARTILVSSNAEALGKVVEEFRRDNLAAEAIPADLSNREQVDRLIEEVKQRCGRLDVMINAAGVTTALPLEEYSDEVWERTLRINLEAPFLLARGLVGLMKDHGGSIINITSLAAELGFPNNPAYAASKGGIKQLSKALAAELGPMGVRVNNIGPGYIRTQMTSFSWDDPQRRQERSDSTLLGRWGIPEDLAGLAVFLAADASSYITGQDIFVDGGWLAKGW
jgi:NAD(P)-dependent dehydrogenase (short-subunit alcohol dehydrogenase family)